jgi:hypothetical protein
LRFLFDEVDLLMSAAALTGAGAIMAVVLVLVDVDAMEAAMMDMLTMGVVFENDLFLLFNVGREGCVEQNSAKPWWSCCNVECLVKRLRHVFLYAMRSKRHYFER